MVVDKRKPAAMKRTFSAGLQYVQSQGAAPTLMLKPRG